MLERVDADALAEIAKAFTGPTLLLEEFEQRAHFVDQVVVPEDTELEPDDRTEIKLLRRSIMELDEKYREPLLLQVVMGHSCKEISTLLGISKSAVMTQLFRAREQLKEKLQKDGVTGNVHGLF